MADTVVVTAPDEAIAVLQPTLSDAIAAAQLSATQAAAAATAAMAAEAIVNNSETVALSAAASATASAASAAAFVAGAGISTTVSLLPAGTEGLRAFATNGRKISEGPGSGSGVPVYYSAGFWRATSTDAPVLA
jgi:hypothetical protein